MKSNKQLKLHEAVFQVKKIAPKLTKELLALEQKLYDLNGTGTKLEKIAIFSTDRSILFNPETWNQQNFIEILTFFHEIEFITEEQSARILEDSNCLSMFKRYVRKTDVFNLEPTFI